MMVNHMDIILLIFAALKFIFPAYCANATPVLAGGGPKMDFGRSFYDGKRIFGNNKTFRGFFFGWGVGIGVVRVVHAKGRPARVDDGDGRDALLALARAHLHRLEDDGFGLVWEAVRLVGRLSVGNIARRDVHPQALGRQAGGGDADGVEDAHLVPRRRSIPARAAGPIRHLGQRA